MQAREKPRLEKLIKEAKEDRRKAAGEVEATSGKTQASASFVGTIQRCTHDKYGQVYTVQKVRIITPFVRPLRLRVLSVATKAPPFMRLATSQCHVNCIVSSCPDMIV